MNRWPEPCRFQDAVHVVHGHSAAGTTYQLAKPRPTVIPLVDNLVGGPCSTDADAHAELRLEFWRAWELGASPGKKRKQDWSEGDFHERHLLAELAQHERKPVVLWWAPTLPVCLSWWWVLDVLERHRLPRQRFWTARPIMPHREPGFEQAPIGTCPASGFVDGLRLVRPLSVKLARAGAVLWRSFAGPSPLRFQKTCEAKAAIFPEMPHVLQALAKFFPRGRETGRRNVRLADVDQTLFNALQPTEWLIPARLFLRDGVMGLMSLLGDHWIPWRLEQWVQHRPNEAVFERKRAFRSRNPFIAFAYRLTRKGVQVRDDGLTEVSEAPSLHMGGWKIYDPNG